jgi:hypothetical protein
VGRHCPAFAVNREVRLSWKARRFHLHAFFFWGGLVIWLRFLVQVLMPIPKPTGFTGADAYKM